MKVVPPPFLNMLFKGLAYTLTANCLWRMLRQSVTYVVSIIQTYRPWTPRQTSGQIVNKKIDAKARLTEISVNDLIRHLQKNAIL